MLEPHFQALEDKIDLVLNKLHQENQALKQESLELEKKNQLACTKLETVIKHLKELDQQP
ncbi:MAG: hypothetical protein JKY01_05975 [Pseudomonadales bacterium]|nr:hypothetical protein [Pseudomonadales bacterium]